MSEQERTFRSKVARVIEQYDLSPIGEELEQCWTRSDDRQSLRDLAEFFNRELLAAAFTESDSQIAREPETLYQQLTDEDVSSGVRAQAESQLRQAGIDVDQLKADFVSYQAIYTYLTEYRGVDAPDESPSEGTHRDRKLQTIQRLKTRLTAVTERSLSELVNAQHLTLGEFDVLVTVRIRCTDCDSRFSITELLTAGGCNCPPEIRE